MREVKCVNDIYDNYANMSMFVKKGIFNIVISDVDHNDDKSPMPLKNKLNLIHENFKIVNKKYTTRVNNIYNTFTEGSIDSVYISMSDFNNYMKVFRNVKLKSLNGKPSDTQIKMFNNIVRLIPDSFMYKEILIVNKHKRYKNTSALENNKSPIFKLHGTIEISNTDTIVSYLKMFTTMTKFESLIKSYAISKI